MDPATQPRLMTAREVAKRLRVTPWAVTEACRRGNLRATRPGKFWLISEEDFQAYLERHRNQPAEPTDAA